MVLLDLFTRVLKPFYEDNLPSEKIQAVIETKTMKNLGMDYHSFETAYYIWRRLQFDANLDLPIPPCNRILPYTHSYWNNMKGASDTTTKLMWNCQVKFASSGGSQLVAAATFLQLYSIYFHREWQITGAKTDLNYYASLHHFQSTCN